MNTLSDLNNLLSPTIKPIRVAFMINEDDSSDVLCIYSNLNSYKTHIISSLYDINPLMNELLQNIKILSNSAYQEMCKDIQTNEVCFLLDWQSRLKKTIIFDKSEINSFSKESFLNILSHNKDELLDIFEDTYNYFLGTL